MLTRKNILAIGLALAIAVAQVSMVAAAGSVNMTACSGPDGGGNYTVTYTDGTTSTTSTYSLTDAQSIGAVDGTGACNPTDGSTLLDLTLIAADPCVLPTDASQPVGEALTGFFCGSLGVDYATIDGWHMDGFGYGVIAQALFTAQTLGLDPQAVLDAKTSGDYSALGIDGVTNWGQLRKYILGQETKSLTNLGAIMSGRATPLVTESPTGSPTASTLSGKGHGNGHGKGGGHGHGH